ncbi:hypothetical protein G4B88_002781, partial [Cannabis sativa]
GRSPNYIWRSIIWGRSLLKKRIRKRVGTRDSILFPKAHSWLWHFTSDGSYSVKSGYVVASTLICLLNLLPKIFWRMHLLKKILNFVWRGFHEILPTNVGLKKRNIIDHSNCPLCGYNSDTNSHAIFLWKLLKFKLLNSLSIEVSFQQIIIKASEVLSQTEFEVFLVAAWYIWGERNKVVHGH